MNFTVTYRKKDGALATEVIDAADRAAAIAAFRQRGIAPTSVTQGGRTPSRTSTAKDNSRKMARFVALAVFLVAIVGGVCWWFASREESRPQTDDKPAKTKTEKPNAKPKSERKPEAAPSQKPTTNAPVAKVEEEQLKWDDSFVTNRELRIKFSVLASSQTNDSGVVTERYRLPNGQFWRRQIDPPPLFDNPSDNAIAMALGDRSGAPIPPYPGFYDANLDEEFVKSLAQPIVIKEDDKPWVVAMKTAVMEAREELANQIKAGDKRSIGEMLRDHVLENNRQANLKGEALVGYQKTLEKDGEAAAAEYLEKVNEALERFGVAPLKAPSRGERRKK